MAVSFYVWDGFGRSFFEVHFREYQNIMAGLTAWPIIGQWGTTLFFYIILMVGILIARQPHFLHDAFACAFAGVGINLFVLCITKCIILAPGVRGSLCRAFTQGERLKAPLESKQTL